MTRHSKTQALIAAAVKVLQEHNPMTVRQVYYQLVSRQVIDNNRGSYQAVSKALVAARREAVIPWEWIEDRTRRPRTVGMWDNLADFAQTAARAYRRNVWESQPEVVECWVEKDALSGIFEDVLRPYGVTLNVGRGYDGWSSIKGAAERDPDTILYFGDFDPTGEDISRSLEERLGELGCRAEIVRCALTSDDVERYDLPPDFTKPADTRSAAFVARHGDRAVELDALPIDVLRERIVSEVESRMDLDALAEVRQAEETDRERLREALAAL